THPPLHTHTHTHTHSRMNPHTHTHSRMNPHTHTHTPVSWRVGVLTGMLRSSCTSTRARPCLFPSALSSQDGPGGIGSRGVNRGHTGHTHTHTHTLTHTHTQRKNTLVYTHSRTDARTHTHTHTPELWTQGLFNHFNLCTGKYVQSTSKQPLLLKKGSIVYKMKVDAGEIT